MEHNTLITPQEADILGGRTDATFRHPGNVKLRNTIVSLLETHHNASRRKEKSDVMKQVVQDINNTGGRFLKYGIKMKVWFQRSSNQDFAQLPRCIYPQHSKCLESMKSHLKKQRNESPNLVVKSSSKSVIKEKKTPPRRTSRTKQRKRNHTISSLRVRTTGGGAVTPTAPSAFSAGVQATIAAAVAVDNSSSPARRISLSHSEDDLQSACSEVGAWPLESEEAGAAAEDDLFAPISCSCFCKECCCWYSFARHRGRTEDAKQHSDNFDASMFRHI
jgi:hypothetical protein